MTDCHWRSILRAFIACALLLGALPLRAQDIVKTEHVRAALVAHAPDGIVAGKRFLLGLQIEHQPGWHTYWKNAGDSGIPTTLEWTLPPGVSAGQIAWPTPKTLPLGPLMNYGYEGSLLLPVEITVPSNFKADKLAIGLRADWLVCKVDCVPESGTFALELPLGKPLQQHTAIFRVTQESLPHTLPAIQAQAKVRDSILEVDVSGMPVEMLGKTVLFFPEQSGVIDNAAKVEQRWEQGRLRLRIPLSSQRSESPATIDAVLVPANAERGIQLRFDVAGGWPKGAQETAASVPVPPVADAFQPSLILTLLLAFAGGALLNLMPCVFPVLSLKILHFAQHAGAPRRLVAGGLAYTLGVVGSFVALAGLLIFLRESGEQLGWGFQLQSPFVVAFLAALFTMIGLNLAGVFEIGSLLPSSLASKRAKNPLLDDALSGMLAVAVASPCTAPFMGAALGAALTLPVPLALLTFAALGLGMAAPYLLASIWPATARLLPRPGAWMVHFKVLMAFPMFGTVVWLVWVLGQQAGINAAAALLGLLVVLAFFAWALGTGGSSRARLVLLSLSSVSLLAALLWAWPILQQETAIDGVARPERSRALEWQPWSAEAVTFAQQAGRPVFVDFTAAWCVTCQFNKLTTLADDDVLADFKAKDTLLLRADWTRRDPVITSELRRLGRSGVPVYALYIPGAAQPQLLSELLTVKEVRNALARK